MQQESIPSPANSSKKMTEQERREFLRRTFSHKELVNLSPPEIEKHINEEEARRQAKLEEIEGALKEAV